MLTPSCCRIVPHVLAPATLRVLRCAPAFSKGTAICALRFNAQMASPGRAVKVADREVGLRELSNASSVAHRPLKRGAGASAQRSVPPATQPSRAWRGAPVTQRLAASMPTRNAAQEPEALRARNHARAAPRIALRLPGTGSANFRTEIGDFPHRLPPKTP